MTATHVTPAESDTDLRAGRRRVARSRGVLSGVLLVVLGAWAALVPFIGPYFDFGFQPRPDDAWHWTSGRGLYEVLPGGVAVLAGLVLLFSASRVLTLLFASLAAAAGAWLVVAPSLAPTIGVEIGAPGNPTSRNNVLAETLLYFFAIGVAIAIIGGIALGRLSTHSVRDVRAAERRAEVEAAEQQRLENERIEHERLEHDRLAAAANAEKQRRHDADHRPVGGHADDNTQTFGQRDTDDRTATLPAVGDRHRDQHPDQHPGQHPGQHHDQHPDQPSPVQPYPVQQGAPQQDVPQQGVPQQYPADDRTQAIPAQPTRPADTAGPRDAAGSSGYLGHRAVQGEGEQPPRNT